LPLGWSLLASALLGLNHSLLIMSRMAMKENLPALVEVVAMTFLLLGLRKRNAFATFIGGAIAALGFYVHYSGRMIFPLWILFLVVVALAYRRPLGLDRIWRHGAIAAAAFALVVTPYAIAHQKAPATLKQHTQEANLHTTKGRELAPALPLAAVAILAIGVWNGFIGWDYIHKGQVTGDDIGSTGRYVQRYSGNPNEHFYLAADQTRYPYYAWGWPSIWIDRLRIFSKDESQIAGVIDPSTVGQFAAVPPFVVFMRSDVWSRS